MLISIYRKYLHYFERPCSQGMAKKTWRHERVILCICDQQVSLGQIMFTPPPPPTTIFFPYADAITARDLVHLARARSLPYNKATSKSYKDVSEVKASLNWQEERSEVREKSTKGKYLRSSLQCLSNDDVLLLLESILQRSKFDPLMFLTSEKNLPPPPKGACFKIVPPTKPPPPHPPET